MERAARVVAGKFPLHAVWVVLPKTHIHGALASYDNFAGTDWASGGAVPECESTLAAWRIGVGLGPHPVP